LDSSIKEYERTRVEIAKYLTTYNSVKAVANEASKVASEKKDAALRSKQVADNAVAAYRSAAGLKNLISTEKPFTVETADTGADIQSSANSADIAKLKQLADQAVARYNQDQRAADIAEKAAAKALADFERVKTTLEAKVAVGKELQVKIRSLQDRLSTNREALANVVSSKNDLTQKMQNAQVQVTSKLNQLTVAQTEAQKAKAIADKAALAVSKHRTDATNADKIATANEAAIEAAKNAAIDIAASSNSLDKIVASKVVDNSLKSLPIIFSIIATVAAVVFVTMYAVRRYRRRSTGVDAKEFTFKEPDLDIQLDFDRILSDIRSKELKRQAKPAVAKTTKTKVAAGKSTTRKATPKKAAPKKP
jgi:hypothetical protein